MERDRVILAIEGLDGSGKRTLTDALVGALADRGAGVATLAFPRYARSPAADLAAEALHGEHGDLGASVYGMAVLFALDRAGVAARIADLTARHDVLLLDRYVASNAAFGAARLHQGADGGFVEWVRRLETERLGLLSPDLQVLLRVGPEVAGERARARAQRPRDAFERDGGLQRRTAGVYEELARSDWLSPWFVADGSGSTAATVTAVLGHLDGLAAPPAGQVPRWGP